MRNKTKYPCFFVRFFIRHQRKKIPPPAPPLSPLTLSPPQSLDKELIHTHRKYRRKKHQNRNQRIPTDEDTSNTLKRYPTRYCRNKLREHLEGSTRCLTSRQLQHVVHPWILKIRQTQLRRLLRELEIKGV